MIVLPSGPSQIPTLKGMPSGVFSGESGPPTCGAGCHPEESFCVEKPLIPECARVLSSDAGNPKQSGSMYSSLAIPNSLRNQLLQYRPWRMIDAAWGEFPSLSPMERHLINEHRDETSCFIRS